jgi:hypothetical protein
MATNKAALRVTELDFDSIKENLKNYLRSQSEFQDFDFEGSGMSVLLDILAYNTHYMSYYLNMVGNEMFLDTAQIRASVLSHAKMIGYIPGSSQGALSKVNIRVTPTGTESNNTNILTLDKYTRLLGQDRDGINYPFLTLDSNTATKIGNSFQFSNVFIKQGEVVSLQYAVTPENDKRRFEIPSATVDTTSIVITVQESSTSSNIESYFLAEDITELSANSAAYFLEENDNLNYSFSFGDGIIGKRPKDGNVVLCTYLDTVGSVSNNISRFVFVEPIGGEYRDNVIVSSTVSSYGGVEKESVEQVRFRAPYFYTTQNRAVTKQDYETLILKDYNYIDAISVWGGEDNDPVVYGKVYLSIKTKGNFALTNLEKEQIKEDLIRSRNILTVTPEIVDPEFAYILVRGKVNYNPSLTSRSAGEIISLTKAAISDYVDAELNTFKSTFRKSKLQAYIEAAEPAIVGSDITIYVQKRLTLDPTRTKSYDVRYNLELRKGDYNISLYTVPQVSTLDFNGITRQVNFEEKPLSATGIDSIIVTNPGINYFSTPTVTINGDGSGATAEAVVRSGRITNINMTNRGSNYTRAEVLILSADGREASAVPRLESRFGVLRSFYFKTNGERVVLNENAGTIDYETGLVSINSFFTAGTPVNQFYDTNVVTFNFPVEREIILPLRNRILTIDENDPQAIQLEAIAET